MLNKAARKRRRIQEDERDWKEIMTEGSEILFSEPFRRALNQIHHDHTTVGKHTLNVAKKSLRISNRLEKMHIHVDRKRMILSALGHDLGIVGNRFGEDFKGKFKTSLDHPKRSVEVASNVADIHKKTATAIKRHMWPICIIPPNSLEGWILTVADKWAAVQELKKTKKHKYINLT